MNLLAERITEYFIRNEITTEDRREENVYGIEVMLGKLLNYITLIVLSVWKKNLMSTVIFMITFFSLRGWTGGFHASKRVNCYLGTIVIFFLVTEIFVPLIKLSFVFMTIILIISCSVIFLLAPINHPNLALNCEEVKTCKNRSRWLAVVFASVAILLNKLRIEPEYISYIVMGVSIDAGLLILAKLKKQEVLT